MFTQITKRWEKWSFLNKIFFIGFILTIISIIISLIFGLIGLLKDNKVILENRILENKDNNKWQKEFEELNNAIETNKKDSLNSNSTSFGLLLKLSTQLGDSDKYIFDAGGKNNNRISLFINKQDELVFRVISKDDNSYHLKIQRKDYSLAYDYPVFLYCDFISNKSDSKLEISSDTNSLGKNDFNHKIEFDFKALESTSGDIDSNKSVKIGSDYNSKNFGAFDIFSFMITKHAFALTTKRKIKNIIKEFCNRKNKLIHYYSYSGDGRRIWK